MIIKDLGLVVEPSGNKQHRVIVECAVCKKQRETRLSRVKDSFTVCKSCLVKARSKTHGLYYHPLKGVYNTMKQRCNNPNATMYYRYGERGIVVCDEWSNDFVSFYNWAMSNGWEKGLTIDRIDNDGNYEPSNCRWVTLQENISRNAKLSKKDIKEICKIYQEEYVTLKDVGEMFNVDSSRIHQILKDNNVKTEYRMVHKNITKKHRETSRKNITKWNNSPAGKAISSSNGKSKRKLSENQVLEIIEKNKKGQSAYSLAKEYPVSKRTILSIIRRETYKEFTDVL